MRCLIDTHVAVWMATNHPKLGARSHAALSGALNDGALCITAISFWEIALLQSRARLAISVRAENLRRSLLQTGVVEIPLSGDIAGNATLVTADERLLGSPHALARQDASL